MSGLNSAPPICPSFEYLYVEEADYQRLSTMKSINATPAVCPHSGRTIYRLKDVIGVKDGLAGAQWEWKIISTVLK